MAKKKKETLPDIIVEHHGSVALIRAGTQAGTDWIESNVAYEGWQKFGFAVAADPRLALNVVAGAQEEGLEVVVR
jgi:hypothetical protein